MAEARGAQTGRKNVPLSYQYRQNQVNDVCGFKCLDMFYVYRLRFGSLVVVVVVVVVV